MSSPAIELESSPPAEPLATLFERIMRRLGWSNVEVRRVAHIPEDTRDTDKKLVAIFQHAALRAIFPAVVMVLAASGLLVLGISKTCDPSVSLTPAFLETVGASWTVDWLGPVSRVVTGTVACGAGVIVGCVVWVWLVGRPAGSLLRAAPYVTLFLFQFAQYFLAHSKLATQQGRFCGLVVEVNLGSGFCYPISLALAMYFVLRRSVKERLLLLGWQVSANVLIVLAWGVGAALGGQEAFGRWYAHTFDGRGAGMAALGAFLFTSEVVGFWGLCRHAGSAARPRLSYTVSLLLLLVLDTLVFTLYLSMSLGSSYAAAVTGLLVMKVVVGFCAATLVCLVAHQTRRPVEAVKQRIGELLAAGGVDTAKREVLRLCLGPARAVDSELKCGYAPDRSDVKKPSIPPDLMRQSLDSPLEHDRPRPDAVPFDGRMDKEVQMSLFSEALDDALQEVSESRAIRMCVASALTELFESAEHIGRIAKPERVREVAIDQARLVFVLADIIDWVRDAVTYTAIPGIAADTVSQVLPPALDSLVRAGFLRKAIVAWPLVWAREKTFVLWDVSWDEAHAEVALLPKIGSDHSPVRCYVHERMPPGDQAVVAPPTVVSAS